MIEDLQFIERDGKKILRMKVAEFQADASGHVCGHIISEWQDVPIKEQK